MSAPHHELPVVDAEVVAVDGVPFDELLPQAVEFPPAVVPPTASGRRTCTCGNVTERGHGRLSCEEVLGIRARVEYGQRVERMSPWRRLRDRRNAPTGWPR